MLGHLGAADYDYRGSGEPGAAAADEGCNRCAKCQTLSGFGAVVTLPLVQTVLAEPPWQLPARSPTWGAQGLVVD
jgi:hypothetical protein